eukprot:353510-Chlamydomonas_euryale.AAC.3
MVQHRTLSRDRGRLWQSCMGGPAAHRGATAAHRGATADWSNTPRRGRHTAKSDVHGQKRCMAHGA